MGNQPSFDEEPVAALMEEVLGYDCSAKNIAQGIRDGRYQKIVVMAGAGISVSCGIPDFRTPGTGLYDNLQRFNLPTPESVFELDFFKTTKGEAFYKLAKEMWPDNFAPSPAHLFVKLLQEKGLLLRCFTQNIDTLERRAGISDEMVVEAHGSFAGSTCTKCKKAFDQTLCKNSILAGNVPVRCQQAGCGGLVKPDIVFFGESLPQKFALCRKQDMAQADLLIIMGTSLTVTPFADLIEDVQVHVPRLLLNMKPVGLRIPEPGSQGLRLRQPENYRDAMVEGTCDDAVRALCDTLGWRNELEDLVEKHQCKVGVSRDAVDELAAFPAMAPEGLAHNWRRDKSKTGPLPEPIEPVLKSQEIEPDQLEAMAVQAQGMALVAFEELHRVRRGGRIAGLLCLHGERHEEWDTTHLLALVSGATNQLDINAVSNSEALQEPMSREDMGKGHPSSFHNYVLRIPNDPELKEVYIWYVNSTLGKVTHRWGPFVLTEPVEGKEDPDDEDDSDDEELDEEALAEAGFDMGDMQDIINSLGDLPIGDVTKN